MSLNAEAASSCSNFENDSSDAESTRSLTPLKVKLQQSPTKISVSIPVSASMSQIGQDPKTLTKTGSARGKKNWEKYGKVRKACKVRYQNGNLAQLTIFFYFLPAAIAGHKLVRVVLLVLLVVGTIHYFSVFRH